MIKNYVLKTVFVAALLFFQIGFPQVGIGTTNPQSTLHVQGTARVTQTDNVTTTTKLAGTDGAGVVCDVKVGRNLSLINNELTASDGDNSYYRVAGIYLPTTFSNYIFDNLNLDLSGVNAGVVVFKLYGSSHNFIVKGITGGTNGRHIILYNSSAVNMKIDHLTSSTPTNTIDTIGTATSTSGIGTVELVYDGAASEWIVTNIRD